MRSAYPLISIFQAIYALKQAADGLNLRFRPPWLLTAGGCEQWGMTWRSVVIRR